MNRNRLGAIAGLLAIVAVGALAISGSDKRLGPRPPEKRPQLALLTSLPLVFSESFGLEGGGSPALTRLEQRYKVTPIGVTNAASLNGQKLLLMAHPRAQPAEMLVELDQWVRAGGHVLLLADPKLEWDSERPLGDRLRPPPAFADTGLLQHWGLVLSGSRADGPVSVQAGRFTLVAVSPGALESRGRCKVTTARLVAHCRIGKGAATIIADADFLNVEPSGKGDDGAQNLDFLADQLAQLESR